jgi:transcription elongation factor GreB
MQKHAVEMMGALGKTAPFMSKAFTKEDSAQELELDLNAVDDEEEVTPRGQKNYMTPAGAAVLRSELHDLLHVKRPEVVRTVSWAASNGDRSENGDYIYGKRRLREIDRRIRFLTRRLESAEVVDPSLQKSDRILFGACVKVEDEQGRVREFQIVGIDEADVARGKVSWISPIAKALLNAKKGEPVILRTPKGEEELVVLDFWFPEAKA